MIVLIAEFKTLPDKRDQMIELSKPMVKLSNQEDGCISYEFLQNPFDPDSFKFVERWRSQKDLDLHFGKPYFKDFTEKFPDLLTEVETLNIYHVSDDNIVA